MFQYIAMTFIVCMLMLSATVSAAPVLFSDGGDNTTASIQATVDAFRAALGNPNNGNAAGPLTSGRREINWDGGGATVNSPVGNPFNGFQNIRGAQFTTPGTGFVQAPAKASGASDDLGTFFGNATYDDTFNFFSPLRLFVPVNSNVTDALFSIPGTGGLARAAVHAFGAIFTDVDLANATQMEFFDTANNSLGSFSVPTGIGANGSLSFLGVDFGSDQIGRVRITTGTAALGPNDNPGGGVDIVAMDDFLYSEPQAIPEPSTWALFGAGAMALMAIRRYRRIRTL